MRAVIDTSVFISTLLSPRGAGAWLLALWKEGRFEVVASPELLAELVEVTERPTIRTRLDPFRRLALLRRLQADATWTPGNTKLEESLRDPQDDFLLRAALESEASFIVTWDNLLLEQGVCQGVKIINPDQFISILVRMKPS
jgi:putative PIN family toxin of toxin-antitoxin system